MCYFISLLRSSVADLGRSHSHPDIFESIVATLRTRYLQKTNKIDHWTGSQLSDHDDWDAEADLKKVVPQDLVISHERFHIVLHNLSPENAKFQLNVKVNHALSQCSI